MFPNKSNTICRLLWYSDCTSKRAVEKIMNLKKMRFLGKMSNKIINIYHHSLFPSQITRKTTAIIIQCLYSTHQVLSKFNALIVLNKAFSKMLKQIKKVCRKVCACFFVSSRAPNLLTLKIACAVFGKKLKNRLSHFFRQRF